MAGDRTLAPRGRLVERHRDFPISEGGRATDELLLKTDMNFMACKARPPFFPVDMEIVQIQVPVAEVGQRRGSFIQYQCFLVAFKAEAVKFRIKRIVESLHEVISQQFC